MFHRPKMNGRGLTPLDHFIIELHESKVPDLTKKI